MKNQNLKDKNIREFYYFENKFPNEGCLVEIVWSDGTSTIENWKENIYSFDLSEVLVIPIRWCRINN